MTGSPGRGSPKVLLLGSSAVGGGAEMRFANLATHLFGGVADALVLEGDPSALRDLTNVRSLGWRSEWSYFRIVAEVRRRMAVEKYDVVLSFGRFPNLVAWLASLGLRAKTSLVLTEVSRPWTELSRMPKGPKSFVQRVLVRRAYSAADFFAANSIDGIEEAIERLGVARQKTCRLPNLLAELTGRAEEPVALTWPSHGLVLIVVGRLEPLKRVDTVIKALSQLSPGTDCSLIVVGDGPDRQELEELARETGVEENVLFTGWLENPLPLIRRADVCILASEYEGFSNTVLEAMMLGTPVITSLCSSDAHRMDADRVALSFAPGSSEGLATAIRRLTTEPGLRSELVGRAEKFSARHTVEAAIGAYEELLRRAAAGSPAGAGLPEF